MAASTTCGVGKVVLITKCKITSVPFYLCIFKKYLQTHFRALCHFPSTSLAPILTSSPLTLWNEVIDYSLPYLCPLFNMFERRLSVTSTAPQFWNNSFQAQKYPTKSSPFILSVLSHRDTWTNFASKFR